MARDAINQVMKCLSLPPSPALPVIPVAGGQDYDPKKLNSLLSETIEDEEIREHLINYYGSRSLIIQEIIKEKGGDRLSPKYPFTTAEVIYVCRYEMAIKVDDVLSRRLRLSFLDANTSQEIKEKVLAIITEEKKSLNLVH
jgi:glycerol-3-phosphate dehydrogenase